MKERDPFTGSLFERVQLPREERPNPITVTLTTDTSTYGDTSDEIFAQLRKRQPGDPERFCMVHQRFEENVAIYIDGKRALFLCSSVAEERGAWKWEGKWPEGK